MDAGPPLSTTPRISPLMLKTLLVFYHGPSPSIAADTPGTTSVMRADILDDLTIMGLISTDASGNPMLTPRGDAFINAVLSTPLPEKIEYWVIPARDEVKL